MKVPIPKIDFTPLTRMVGKVGFEVVKNSPTILLVAGIGLIGAGVYFACKKTLSPELHQAAGQLKFSLDQINDEDAPESYTTSAKAMDTAREFVIFFGKTVKVYWLPALLLASGIGAICWSHAILTGRLAATTAALLAMTQAYEAERNANYTERVDEDGRHYIEKSLDENLALTDGKGRILPNPYSIYIDKDNFPMWNEKDPRITSEYLKQAERDMNNKFRTKGVLFLNEVYDRLGMPPTDIGAVVGWIRYDKSCHISFVPIWMYDELGPEMQDWVHGRQRLGEPGMDEVLLEFNCQGPIIGAKGVPDEEYIARRQCLDEAYAASRPFENPRRVMELDYDMEDPEQAAEYDAMLLAEMEGAMV